MLSVVNERLGKANKANRVSTFSDDDHDDDTDDHQEHHDLMLKRGGHSVHTIEVAPAVQLRLLLSVQQSTIANRRSLQTRNNINHKRQERVSSQKEAFPPIDTSTRSASTTGRIINSTIGRKIKGMGDNDESTFE